MYYSRVEVAVDARYGGRSCSLLLRDPT